MRITKPTRTTIKIAWICLLVIAVPFVIQFGFIGVLAFLFSGWGARGGQLDSTPLLMTIIPTAVLAVSTYYLFKWLRKLEKQEVLIQPEATWPSVTVEEQQILNALEQNGGLTLNQLTTITGVETDKLMSILTSLLSKNLISQKIDSNLAIFFLTDNT